MASSPKRELFGEALHAETTREEEEPRGSLDKKSVEVRVEPQSTMKAGQPSSDPYNV
jgi:hypothetical protein